MLVSGLRETSTLKGMRETKEVRRLIRAIQTGERARSLLGAAVRKLREANELQQQTFAGQLGISPQHLSDVEGSNRGLSDEILAKLETLTSC